MRAELNGGPLVDSATNKSVNVVAAAVRLGGELNALLDGKPGRLVVELEPDVRVTVELGKQPPEPRPAGGKRKG